MDGVDEVDDRRVVATPGELVAAREARGMSQIDISQRIKLRIRQVAALEEGSWDLLPGRAFARGALRSYGKLVDADVSPLLDSIGMTDAVTQLPLGAISTRTGPLTSVALDGRRRGRPMLWVIGGLIAVVGLVVYFGGDDESRQPPSAAPVELAPRGASSGEAVDLDSGSATEPAGPAAATGSPANQSAGSGQHGTAGATGGVPGDQPPAGAAATGASIPGGSDSAPGGSLAASAAGSAGSARGAGSAAAGSTTASGSAAAGSAVAAGAESAADSAARAPLAGGPASAGSSGSAEAAGDATPAAGSGSGPGVIRFTTTENAWVAVRDATGRQIHGAVVPAGTTIAVQGKPPYQLTLGNAARMKVQYEGKDRKVPPPNEKNIARLELP